jgi:hypothetical protein
VAAALRPDHLRHEALDDVDRSHEVHLDDASPVTVLERPTVPQTEIPAMFMSTSMLPKRAWNSFAKSVTASKSEMSSARNQVESYITEFHVTYKMATKPWGIRAALGGRRR